jgi:hypothetical protein
MKPVTDVHELFRHQRDQNRRSGTLAGLCGEFCNSGLTRFHTSVQLEL